MLAAIDIGSPLDDPRGFRRALGHFATGVTIITTQCDGELAGMTANSFSSVSLDPPLVLWSIGKSSLSLTLFEKADCFAINVLAADQLDLAQHFARSRPDKFAGLKWQAGIGGAPCLPGVSAAFECSKHAMIDAGDHFICLGRVERYSYAEREPLLFSHGRFGLSVDFPVLGTDVGHGTEQASAANDQTTMLGLLWDAFTSLSHGFESEREALGLSVSQGRVLSLIERYPGAQLDMIARKAYISPQGAEDAVQSLIANGYARVGQDGCWNVTAKGYSNVTLRRQRAAAFDASRLKSFTAAELEATSRVLTALGAG